MENDLPSVGPALKSEFPDPDISVADEIAVILQPDGSFSVSTHFRKSDVFRCSPDFGIQLNDDTIVEYSHTAGCYLYAIVVETWCSV
jgi:hypothetical protein